MSTGAAGAAATPRWRGIGATLTSRGWGLSVAAVALVVAGRLVGIVELYPVAAGAGALVVASAVWCRTRRWQVDVGRRLQPGRTEAGRGATVAISLRNRSARSSPTLVLRDPFGGHHGRTLTVAPLAPGGRTTGTYPLAPSGRGVYLVGPLTLETTDPFGLARGVRTSALTSRWIVHPHVERLRAPTVGAGADRRAGAVLPVPGRDNDEFSALREYRPGDDLRRMHWPSTARTDTLMVREDQMERRSQVCVVVDLRRSLWTAPGFERGLSAAASIACAALDGGFQTRLVTSAGADSGIGSGSGQRSRILDLLAEAEPAADAGRPGKGGDRSFGSLPLPAGGTVVVVTSERADMDELRRLARLGRAVQLTVVVIERGSGSSGRGATLGAAHRMVRVSPTTGLAAAWDRAG